jgi:hypothetical protein
MGGEESAEIVGHRYRKSCLVFFLSTGTRCRRSSKGFAGATRKPCRSSSRLIRSHSLAKGSLPRLVAAMFPRVTRPVSHAMHAV